MILLAALFLGLLAGAGLARWRGRPYQVRVPQYLWIVPTALVLQLSGAFLPASLARVMLPLSLALFLGFVWVNRRLPGMVTLLVGLVLNLAVISANGGWMPISPQTASRLPGWSPVQTAQSGMRIGQKDVLLEPPATRLEWLADRTLLPDWIGYPTAFSLGDVLIAIGAFWFLARPPEAPKPKTE